MNAASRPDLNHHACSCALQWRPLRLGLHLLEPIFDFDFQEKMEKNKIKYPKSGPGST